MRRPPPAKPEDAEEFFAGHPVGLEAFRRVHSILTGYGPCGLRVAKTQVGWARRRGFAYLWMPDRWLKSTSTKVVLTIDLPRRDPSRRWKQVVEPRPRLFTHHLELRSSGDIDDEVEQWLHEAYDAAA